MEEPKTWGEMQKIHDWWWKLPLEEKKRLNRRILGEKDRLTPEDFTKLWNNK